MTRYEELKELVGTNVLYLEGLKFYKGCDNEQGVAIEMYSHDLGYLVAEDNIVVFVSIPRVNALNAYNNRFD